MPLIEACFSCGHAGTGVYTHPVLPNLSSCDNCDAIPTIEARERERGVATRYQIVGKNAFDVPRSDGSVTRNARITSDAWRNDFVNLHSNDVIVPVSFTDSKTGFEMTKRIALSAIAALNANAPLVHVRHDSRYLQRSLMKSAAAKSVVRKVHRDVVRIVLRKVFKKI